MADTLTIEAVNELIAQHSDKARDAIEKLADYCQQDKNGETPLNVAVQSHNHDIVMLLAESEGAVNFWPKIDDHLLKPVRYSVGAIFTGKNIEQAEQYLRQSFGPFTCLQRTPLHIACRHGVIDAIELLISKNAALDAKDLLGLTPFELCILSGGANAADRFVSCCVASKRKLSMSEIALQAACPDTALYEKLIHHGTLNIKAKRFAFSLACALLGKDAVNNWFQQGLDINKMTNKEFSPIFEICTSQSLSLYDHPDAPRLAGQYVAKQPAGMGGIHIDNDDIMNAESLEDIEALFSEATDQAASKKTEQTSYVVSDEERQSQLSLRLELIDMLVEHGMDVGFAEEKAPYGFWDKVKSINSPELLQALTAKGFSLGQKHPKSSKRVKAIRDSKLTWELAGESMLLAETEPKEPTHSKPVIVRLTHNNVYGPVDGIKLSLRSGDEWHSLVLVEELMTVGGDEVDGSSVTEPVYDETPWEATYECELHLDTGKQTIEIKIESDIEGLAGEISDWTVDVK